MRTLRICVFALVLAGTLGLAGMANAAVLSPAMSIDRALPEELSDGLVTKVRGCHRRVRRHWVNRWGERRRHFHRGRRCRPVRAGGRPPPPPRHCHRGAARHYHDIFGRRRHHVHRGRNCRPLRLRRHRNEGFGRPPGCFRVGPVWYCP